MLNNWSNTQKALAAAGIVLLILLIMNWSSVWAWVKSLGSSDERTSESTVDEPAAPQQQVVQNVIVAPRPVQVTCDRLKQEISHFTSLLAQYPTSVQIKNRLDQLKQQYAAQNCTGGPKPNPNAAA